MLNFNNIRKPSRNVGDDLAHATVTVPSVMTSVSIGRVRGIIVLSHAAASATSADVPWTEALYGVARSSTLRRDRPGP